MDGFSHITSLSNIRRKKNKAQDKNKPVCKMRNEKAPNKFENLYKAF